MRNYSDELDRRVRDTLFDRLVKRADELVTRERTTNMNDLQEVIMKLTECIDALKTDMQFSLRPTGPEQPVSVSGGVAGTSGAEPCRSELCDSLRLQVQRIIDLTDVVQSMRERLDLP